MKWIVLYVFLLLSTIAWANTNLLFAKNISISINKKDVLEAKDVNKDNYMKYALKLFKEIKKTDSIIYRRGGDYDFISFAF